MPKLISHIFFDPLRPERIFIRYIHLVSSLVPRGFIPRNLFVDPHQLKIVNKSGRLCGRYSLAFASFFFLVYFVIFFFSFSMFFGAGSYLTLLPPNNIREYIPICLFALAFSKPGANITGWLVGWLRETGIHTYRHQGLMLHMYQTTSIYPMWI